MTKSVDEQAGHNQGTPQLEHLKIFEGARTGAHRNYIRTRRVA